MENIGYTMQIIRSKRKTMTIEITAAGKILIRAPWDMPEWRIREFVKDKAAWIEHHLNKRLEDSKVFQKQGLFKEEEIQKMIQLAQDIIPGKVAYYARKIQVTYGKVSVRKQKSRWGSCSREGNLSFNCLLMLAPSEILDYVVVHELCHRLEMNHSMEFWHEVEKVLPDYRRSKMWLQENGNRLMLRLHGCDE